MLFFNLCLKLIFSNSLDFFSGHLWDDWLNRTLIIFSDAHSNLVTTHFLQHSQSFSVFLFQIVFKIKLVLLFFFLLPVILSEHLWQLWNGCIVFVSFTVGDAKFVVNWLSFSLYCRTFNKLNFVFLVVKVNFFYWNHAWFSTLPGIWAARATTRWIVRRHLFNL